MELAVMIGREGTIDVLSSSSSTKSLKLENMQKRLSTCTNRS